MNPSRSLMNEEISEKISALSFIFACGVVLFHFDPFNIYGIGFNENGITDVVCRFINTWINYLAAYGNHFFFLISAFLLYYNLDNKNYKTKIKRRLATLMIPYLIWQFVYLIVLYPTLIAEVGFDAVIEGLLTSGFDGPLWFVLELTILLIFVKPLMLIMQHQGLREFFLLLLFVLGVVIRYSFIPWGDGIYSYTIKRFTGYLFTYYFGAYIASVFPQKVLKQYSVKEKIVAVIVLGITIIIPQVITASDGLGGEFRQ